ncbi:alpha/beta fold hydrolase [Massilia sp. LXY-6]|uniref:alpha/beta fold hydrolase n=1 Tax=Massilia sp. LXY-6 TaxID=3379823 RepID=UPI003EDEFC63
MKPFACTKPFAVYPIAVGVLVAILFSGHGHAAETSAPQANRFASTIAPAERFEVDGVLVEQYGKPGSRGRPLVLVPGLASGGWVWQEAVRAFSPDHVVYVLTLPGFDGRPPAPANAFAASRAAVEKLIEQRHLDKPVIVGHSLGATLALALAENRPARVGGVVAIDGLPVMPGTEALPPAERARYAQGMKGRMAGLTPALFAKQQQAYMRTIGVLDMGKADDVALLTGRSDPASVGQYAADVVELDLRPGLKNIQAPVLVISPFFDADGAQQGLSAEAKADYYRALMQGAPKVDVVTVAPARHFAMIDQPQLVNDAIRKYLASL